MLKFLYFFMIVVAGTGGELCVSRAMKQVGEVHDFRPAAIVRVIGRARVYKAHALLLGCDETGLKERELTKRALPDEFRQIKKETFDTLQVWKCDGDSVAETRPL